MQVRWHRSLDDVRGDLPALYIAHEFFDALPVHHFQRTSRGWRERLVDVSQDPTDPHHLRLVLAPNETPASKLLLPPRLAGLTPAESKTSLVIGYHLLANGMHREACESLVDAHALDLPFCARRVFTRELSPYSRTAAALYPAEATMVRLQGTPWTSWRSARRARGWLGSWAGE